MSPVQWSQPDLVERVLEIVKRAGVKPEYIEIELTESCLMENLERTHNALKALRSYGFKVSVDDFGTGYSALGYLRELPIDTLKIDRCFITELDSSPDDLAIVEAIISMAKALDLQVVAEGVESINQLGLLKRLDCNQAQGYYYSRPVPAREALSMLGEAVLQAPA